MTKRTHGAKPKTKDTAPARPAKKPQAKPVHRRPAPAREREVPASIVVSGKALPATKAEFERHVDAVVDHVNVSLRKIGLSHEELADELFRLACNNDVAAAFDLRANPPPLYVALRARADKSLTISSEELSVYVKVGALRQRVREPVFQTCSWSDKKRLLALVDDPRKLVRLHAALKHMTQKNASGDSLADWVRRHTPPKGDGRPRGLSIPGARGVVRKGLSLGTPEGRAQLVKQLRAAKPSVRQEMLRDLRATVKNLETVVAEVEDDDDPNE